MKHFFKKGIIRIIFSVFKDRRAAPRPPKKIKLDLQTLKMMVKEIMTTQENEITCGECYEELDRYVELYLAGKDVTTAMPLVKQHLEHCPDCREEFELLLKAIQSLS